MNFFKSLALFTALLFTATTALSQSIIINEVDADQSSPQMSEELVLPTPIRREDLYVNGAWAAPIQKYFDFDTSFYSQVSYDYSSAQNSTWADIIEMNFDGAYTSLNLAEQVFGSPQDSLNGLTFDISKDRKTLLVNFWGEGEYGSWYYPNVLVLYDLERNTHEVLYDRRGTDDSTFYTNVLFDLNGDGILDIYLGGAGYIINNGSNEVTHNEEGPGPVFVLDIDSDDIDDLIHYDSSTSRWIKYKGGENLQKTTIESDYIFKNFVDDYIVFDFDLDGDDDLFVLDALTDPTNDGCEVCIGKISVLVNDNGNLLDVTESIFNESTFPQLLGDNNILSYDYDSDGDMDIFFPDYYIHNKQLMNDYFWENRSGAFIKRKRSDLPYDLAEFVELYDGGTGFTDLSGYVLVFYNGSGDVSYDAFDLDGYTTSASGFFVVCGDAQNVEFCDLDVSGRPNLIQNGADAVALYVGDASSFPDGTPVTTDNLVDALVYDTADDDDAGLLVLLNANEPQVDERGGGDGTVHSNQRNTDGEGGARNTSAYVQRTPTPGATNTVSGTNTDATDLPAGYSLSAAYPNPFNPTTSFTFALPQAQKVRITATDLLGREVAILMAGETISAGAHTMQFNAAGLASGTYLIRMEAGSFMATQRVTLLK